MSRIRLEEMFSRVAGEDRAAFLPFMTTGLPDLDTTVELFQAMAIAGADAFEMGIPYSDPLMDGPVIQAASERALAGGANVEFCLGAIEKVVAATGVPVLAMTYANPVFRIGPDEFCRRLATSGASGLIVADVPVEESRPLLEATKQHNLGLVLFVAPTSSDDRLVEVAEADPVFVYAVADLGVTGARAEVSERAHDLAARLQQTTQRPVVAGVGISSPEQAATFARLVDGVIVGTDLVRRVLEAESPAVAIDQAAAAVAAYRAALSR